MPLKERKQHNSFAVEAVVHLNIYISFLLSLCTTASSTLMKKCVQTVFLDTVASEVRTSRGMKLANNDM